jgi:glycosyltransferase involved in cell wall biosynthesis
MKSKKTNEILVYGNFMLSKPGYGGQITKTRNVYECLLKKYGVDKVSHFNMEKWKRKPFSTLIKLRNTVKHTKNMVILPGDNNLKFLLTFIGKYIKKYNVSVFYMVVGGWLFDYLNQNKKKIADIALFTGVFVETLELKIKLETLGLNNIYYSPVFSLRIPTARESIPAQIEYLKTQNQLKFCTFSRVLKEKGIEDAANAIKKMNEEYGIGCTLDIYGAIDQSYIESFNLLLKSNSYIEYKGFIKDDKVIDTLTRYHALIFATYYYGEGFPAALLEANMAALPIVASNWKYNSEIIENGVNGLLFEPKNIDDLTSVLLGLAHDRNRLYQMRYSSFEKSQLFTPQYALKPLFELIDKKDI